MKEINLNNLSESEKKIADYIMKNKYSVPYMSINKISEDLNMSIATVSRFWKKIGYKNFKDFKNYAIENLEITPASKVKTTMKQINKIDLIDKIFSLQINHLKRTLDYLSSEEFKIAIETILKAKKIYIYGPGPSSGLVNVIYHRLNRFSLNLGVIDCGGSELFEHLINIEKNDAVIVFGFSKKLVETHVILDYGKKVGYKTILLTDLLVSDMNSMADINLYAYRGNLWEFHSMVSPMALVDCLIVGIALQIEDKALNKLENLSKLRDMYSDYILR